MRAYVGLQGQRDRVTKGQGSIMVRKPPGQEAGTHVSTTSLRQREQMYIHPPYTHLLQDVEYPMQYKGRWIAYSVTTKQRCLFMFCAETCLYDVFDTPVG